MAFSSRLLTGIVAHRRLRPVKHRFRHRTPSLLIDLDEAPELDRRLRLFGYNRAALFSVRDKNLGPLDRAGAPKRWIARALASRGIDIENGRVLVHLFPAFLGRGFAPLTTWFCHGAEGGLRAILYEVHNTFGERHAYLAAVDSSAMKVHRHIADKAFHVSPFIPPAMRYRFATRPPGADPGAGLTIVIRETETETGALTLIASHVAAARPLTDAALVKAAMVFPIAPLGILSAIHWEALRLWLKGAPVFEKPAAAPERMISTAAPLPAHPPTPRQGASQPPEGSRP